MFSSPRSSFLPRGFCLFPPLRFWTVCVSLRARKECSKVARGRARSAAAVERDPCEIRLRRKGSRGVYSDVSFMYLCRLDCILRTVLELFTWSLYLRPHAGQTRHPQLLRRRHLINFRASSSRDRQSGKNSSSRARSIVLGDSWDLRRLASLASRHTRSDQTTLRPIRQPHPRESSHSGSLLEIWAAAQQSISFSLSRHALEGVNLPRRTPHGREATGWRPRSCKRSCESRRGAIRASTPTRPSARSRRQV